MTKTATLLAALVLALGASTAIAGGYAMDAKGKCHDEHGKFAKASFCKAHAYKMDAKGKCRDERGRFADMKLCHM